MDWIYCEHCGQIIGAYEPARAIRADGTSLQGPTLELRSELKTPGTVAAMSGAIAFWRRRVSRTDSVRSMDRTA